MPMSCLRLQTLTFAQRPFQDGEVRTGNKGVPMFCPFVKAQERHNGGMFVCIFGNNTAQASHAAKKAKELASCFVLAVNANRGARPTAPNAMLPSLPAGCFESTTRCAVFLRVVGDVASTVCSAMLLPRHEWQDFCADARC